MRIYPIARTSIAVFLLSLFALPAGVSDGIAFAAEEKKQTRRIPTMSESTYKKLAEVQEFIDAEDYQGAMNALNAMLDRRRRFNGNELGQIYNMMAFVYYALDRYDKAITAYEQVLAQGAWPRAPCAIPLL